jgi:hypothetical protein
MGYSAKGKQCDIEIPICRIMRQSGEAFSTHTILRKCEPTFEIGCRWRGVARTEAQQAYSRELREIEIGSVRA